jgi:DNA (cytosine-5)-methyltransferase 1
MRAYYNEHDPRSAAWLRELIRHGHIADGVVDERSIEDVHPGDLAGHTQCHFFAGIGGWSLALRIAGWPDDRPVWTGSCPCQPFSAAGQGAGFDDERHLWPAWHHLISERRPAVVFGEQVASRDGLGWLDLVSTDMEAAGYAFGAADLCAAGVGAPHIRQRIWFVAESRSERRGRRQRAATGCVPHGAHARRNKGHDGSVCADEAGSRLADSSSPRLEGRDGRALGHQCAAAKRSGGAGALADREEFGRIEGWRTLAERTGLGDNCGALRLAYSNEPGLGPAPRSELHDAEHHAEPRGRTFWSAAEWIACRDGKARPVEPGVEPLAHGVSGRVGLLRGYGNAIVPEAAAAFIRAFDEPHRMKQGARP